ncbi:MAG: D-alanine--D-alanine ligase [Candidatus Brocadiae bacterium]|nr:D-alanine--D-alanine ligase [Candidatus Brocadiia bacterium]
MEKKKNIAVLFGGRSTEHEVSLTSASYVLQNIDKNRFSTIPILLSRSGQWFLCQESFLQQKQGLIQEMESAYSKLPPVILDYTRKGKLLDIKSLSEIAQMDALFPILHGTYGEDGTIQGLAKMADIPCVGAGIIGSAAGMDKIIMKRLFLAAGLPVLPFIFFSRTEWKEKKAQIIKDLEQNFRFPLFVKPANGGSSIGISKVKTKGELESAIQEASRFDRKILVEQGINARELECGVLGNEKPRTSVVGEIIPKREFYDEIAKYEEDSTQTPIPAALDESTTRSIQDMSAKAFLAIDCAGFARVDFLMDKDSQKVYLNEINTIPGFTSISMYPKMWNASGISYQELLTKLIDLAIDRFEEEKSEVKFR